MNISYTVTEERINYGRANDVREISVVHFDQLFSELDACGVPARCWNFGPGTGPTLNGRFIRWCENR